MALSIGIIFDVSSRMDDLISILKQQGYHQSWSANAKQYSLPHNMLWKKEHEMQDALKDVATAIALLNKDAFADKITLLKCIALRVFPWDGIADLEKTKETKIAELKKQLEELESQ